MEKADRVPETGARGATSYYNVPPDHAKNMAGDGAPRQASEHAGNGPKGKKVH